MGKLESLKFARDSYSENLRKGCTFIAINKNNKIHDEVKELCEKNQKALCTTINNCECCNNIMLAGIEAIIKENLDV